MVAQSRDTKGGKNKVMTTWSPMAEPSSLQSQENFDLTPRQLRIVAAVVGGYSDHEIAQMLSISKVTVVEELAEVSEKLGVQGRLEMALFAIHHRLLAGMGNRQ